MKSALLAAAALALTATGALAAPEKYVLDPGHSQVMFSYNHLGYSTTYNIFSGFEGEIQFDQQDPANSSVSVAIPVRSLFTGWEKRFDHMMSDEFFGAAEGDLITFTSTGIEVTGDNTALISGDLTIKGETRPVILDARLNQSGEHPMAGKPWAGFDATTTINRSEFGLSEFVPYVGDALDVHISIEAMKAD